MHKGSAYFQPIQRIYSAQGTVQQYPSYVALTASGPVICNTANERTIMSRRLQVCTGTVGTAPINCRHAHKLQECQVCFTERVDDCTWESLCGHVEQWDTANHSIVRDWLSHRHCKSLEPNASGPPHRHAEGCLRRHGALPLAENSQTPPAIAPVRRWSNDAGY